MSNLWEWLLQTLSVTLVAALLLAVKALMADKLSPRWQYGVWGLLALRILLPVRVGRTVLLPLPLWMEILKTRVEAHLSSAYAAPYEPLSIRHVLPLPSGAPQSVTDWIFVLLAAGSVLCALWYLLAYLRLRRLLRHSEEASEARLAQVAQVCAEYGLRSCRVVQVRGLPSAFVCGLIRPVLALPADGEAEVDDKILLHELLHLKYRDAWQNVFWCLLRCLHWYNPLVHLAINRIENDMESLCDQRVLERLVGEERREYGAILLAMANDRFARAPGSSSISNGGKNIARRIAAIVRFKKYPRGMALVSVCIVLVLLWPTLIGTAHIAATSSYEPGREQLSEAMALSRLRRCETVAGAIDTYAKGLMLENGIYIATAAPLSRQQELTDAMTEGTPYTHVWHLDSGAELENVQLTGYELYDLVEQADGSYTAYLLFDVNGVDDSLLDISAYADEREALFGCCVIVPIRIYAESGWVVEERGARTVLAVRPDQSEYIYDDSLPFRRVLTAETAHGTVTVSCRTAYHVNNTVTTDNAFLNSINTSSFSRTIDPSATFEYIHTTYFLDYTCTPDAAGRMPTEIVSIKIVELESADEKFKFPEVRLEGSSSGSSSDGYSWINHLVREGWDGTVWTGSGNTYFDIDDFSPNYPAAFGVQILWDREVVEEVILKEVTP